MAKNSVLDLCYACALLLFRLCDEGELGKLVRGTCLFLLESNFLFNVANLLCEIAKLELNVVDLC